MVVIHHILTSLHPTLSSLLPYSLIYTVAVDLKFTLRYRSTIVQRCETQRCYNVLIPFYKTECVRFYVVFTDSVLSHRSIASFTTCEIL